MRAEMLWGAKGITAICWGEGVTGAEKGEKQTIIQGRQIPLTLALKGRGAEF